MAYQAFGPQRSEAGIPFTILRPEAADEVHTVGALVLVDGDGNIAECGDDPAVIFGIAQTAGHDAAVATTLAEVHVIDSKREYDGVAKGTLTATMVGEDFGVLKSTDDIWVIDLADTTNTCVTIIDIPETSTVGGTDQIVTFRFMQANIQTP